MSRTWSDGGGHGARSGGNEGRARRAFDVIVVGARVAGSSLASHLAGSGIRVCLLDVAEFPSDTLSTHIFQDLPALDRLGVLDRLLATGAPVLPELSLHVDDVDLSMTHPDLACLCVRRPLLDQILLDRAVEMGAEAHTGTRVVELLYEAGRVRGVRATDSGGRTLELEAPLVVGADGRNSTVARLVGARRYNVSSSERAAIWAYYEGVDAPPAVLLQRLGGHLLYGAPADSGLFLVIAAPGYEEYHPYRANAESAFERWISASPRLAALVGGRRPLQPLVVVPRWQGFFRQSAGPGWALVGDAGHFKDPSPGQGISDALRQSERLAGAIVAGLGQAELDRRLRRWTRWRDKDAAQMYWFAQDLGRRGPTPAVVCEMLRRISEKPKWVREAHEALGWHLRAPSRVLSPPRLFGACGRMLLRRDLRRGLSRREVLGETKTTAVRDLHRRLLNHRPRFETRSPVGRAGDPERERSAGKGSQSSLSDGERAWLHTRGLS